MNWGWKSGYLTWTLLSLPLLLGFAIVFSHQLPAASTHKEEEASTGNVLTAALRLPVVWWPSLFLLLYVGIQVSRGNSSDSVLVATRHQQVLLSSLT